MKTEKLSTRNDVDEYIQEFVNLIRNFTYNELYDILRKSDGSIVYTPNGEEYFVGRYVIRNIKPLWRVENQLGDIQFDFCNKSAAIFYAMALMKTKINLARQLETADYAFRRSKSQWDLYKQKIKIVLKQGDESKVELMLAKHSDCKYKYIIAKEELEKTLNMAKYLKLGT